MKKTLILPLLFILLISVVTAQLSYDTTISNPTTQNIYGLTEHSGSLYLSTYTGLMIELNSSLDEINSESIGYQYESLTSDGNYIYGEYTLSNPDRIYKLDPNNNFSQESYRNVPVTTIFVMGYNDVDGNLLLGTAEGLVIYDYETDTIVDTIIYDELDESGAYSNQYSVIVEIGDNFYIGVPNETIQINKYYNVVQEMLVKDNTGVYFNAPVGTYFNGVIYSRTASLSNDIIKWSSTGEETSEYIYLNNVFYSPIQCVTEQAVTYSYVLCNDTRFIEYGDGSIGYQCNSPTAETECNGLCLTSRNVIDGNTYVSGACDPSNCEVECKTIGEATSTGLTTYKVCGQYDDDVCLEYGSVITCPTGSYFYDAGLSYCSEYNYSNYNTTFLNSNWYTSYNTETEVTSFSELDLTTIINTYLAGINLLSSYSPLVSDDNTYFKSKYLENGYKVHSALNIAYVNFGIVYPDLIEGKGYASINCDYSETPIIENTDRAIFNTTRTITTDVTGKIVTTSLTYVLNDTDNMRQTMLRVSPSLNHVLDLNVTNKTMVVYSNDEVIFNQTTADYIELVNVYCDYDFINYLRSCYVFISDGLNNYEVYETPVSFSGTPAPASTYYEISPSDSTLVTGYAVTSISTREGFTAFNEGSYPFSCEILEGGQIIRTYQNNGEIPSYLDFKDTYLNVDLGTLTPTQEDSTQDAIFGGELTPTKKIIYAVLISLFLAIILFVITSQESVPEKAGGLIASAGLIGSLIVFTIIGWLPVFVAVVMFILSAGIVAIVFRNGIGG